MDSSAQVVIAIALGFTLLVSTISGIEYLNKEQKYECVAASLERNIPAIEIQAICNVR